MAGDAGRAEAVASLGLRHRRRQVRLALGASRAAAREWGRMDPGNLSGAWQTGTGRRVLAVVVAAQQASAQGATDYVSEAVRAQGTAPDPAGTVDAAAFAGIAADGRRLDTLLAEPVITVKTSLAGGSTLDVALEQGLASLLRIVESEVADAGRAAVGTAITADRKVSGYVRVLSPPSCARCVILAGKTFHSAVAFQRHPHCDCVHMPTVYGWAPHRTDPDAYFHSLSEAEQNRAFGRAGARAIRDGADIGQVVNARRGMYAVGDRYGLKATREGMTKRGLARQRLRALEGAGRAKGTVRLMPESIYRIAADRDEAIRLLYRYGYLY
jgi:hypothetical protein